MKHSITTKLFVLAACAGSAHAALTIQNSNFYEEGDNGGIADVTIPFTINTTDSILVVGVYVDGLDPTTTATFNGVSPNMTHVSATRTISFVFLNPATGAGSLFLDPALAAAGIGAIFYEVGGANLATVNFVTDSTTITTDTANELVIGFGGRNGGPAPSVGGSSILTRNDALLADEMRGGGALASGTGTAATAGVQNISWADASHGTITYSFDAVPEPSMVFLTGLTGGLFLLRRRRAA